MFVSFLSAFTWLSFQIQFPVCYSSAVFRVLHATQARTRKGNMHATAARMHRFPDALQLCQDMIVEKPLVPKIDGML